MRPLSTMRTHVLGEGEDSCLQARKNLTGTQINRHFDLISILQLYEARQANGCLIQTDGNVCIKQLIFLATWHMSTRGTKKVLRVLIWGLQKNFSK